MLYNTRVFASQMAVLLRDERETTTKREILEFVKRDIEITVLYIVTSIYLCCRIVSLLIIERAVLIKVALQRQREFEIVAANIGTLLSFEISAKISTNKRKGLVPNENHPRIIFKNEWYVV